jgi:serine/threonine-protein kinase
VIQKDLQRMPVGERKFRRYLLIHNLHNDRSVDEKELKLTRAAIGKVINSLSNTAQIAKIRAIDPDKTVFAFDLRDVGWDLRDLWTEILKNYPYGMTHIGNVDDEKLNQIAQDIAEMVEVKLPYVRADWLIVNGGQPPLYHTLLGLPDSVEKLERTLEIDIENNFLNDRVKRAGFSKSGISSQNRMVERHLGKVIYWRSYDFRQGDEKSNIFRFPLGPVFAKNPHADQAFVHAGSEIVFSLPNGMPAYFLANAKGERIDHAPIEIVSDRQKPDAPQVVNGLSCMRCHEQGIKKFKDEVRQALEVASVRDKVNCLYIENAAMDDVVRADQEQFFHAISKAMGAYAVEDEEPIGKVETRYTRDLGAAQVAAEFGLESEAKLLDAIRGNGKLNETKLKRLLSGNTIKRWEWESRENSGTSLFQDAAAELRQGAPFLFK